MGAIEQLGELARSAFDEAVKAYKASIRIEGMIELMQKGVDAFEKRTGDRLDSTERRLESRLEAYEARIRELENRVASLTGKVDGAMADAVSTVLLQPEIQRKLSQVGRSQSPAAPKLSPLAPESGTSMGDGGSQVA